MGRDWSVGSTLRYGTGTPITPVPARRARRGRPIAPAYGALMSERLPAYGRLDARVMRFVRLPSGLLSTYVEALNVTGRRNVAAMSYDAAYARRVPVHTFFATRTIVVGAEWQVR